MENIGSREKRLLLAFEDVLVYCKNCVIALISEFLANSKMKEGSI